MAVLVPSQDALIEEFRAASGWIDSDSFQLRQIDGMGWGSIASRDLSVGSVAAW